MRARDRLGHNKGAAVQPSFAAQLPSEQLALAQEAHSLHLRKKKSLKRMRNHPPFPFQWNFVKNLESSEEAKEETPREPCTPSKRTSRSRFCLPRFFHDGNSSIDTSVSVSSRRKWSEGKLPQVPFEGGLTGVRDLHDLSAINYKKDLPFPPLAALDSMLCTDDIFLRRARRETEKRGAPATRTNHSMT